MSTQGIIRQMIVHNLRFTGSESELTDGYGLLDNAVIDSMGIFKLVGLLEDHFGIEIDEEDMVSENFETIDAVAALVATKGG